MTQPDTMDAASLTFEQARDALVEVVEKLQTGTNSLQESLDLWEHGERLAQRCEEFLAEARARVERVVAQTRGGQPGVRDGDASETEAPATGE